MLIDTHCHLTSDALRGRAAELVAAAGAAGVTRLITVATDPADAAAAVELVAAQAGVYMAAGIHPHEAGNADDAALAAVRDLHLGRGTLRAPAGRLVAVGETGLDFHYDFAPRARQYEVFETQLQLAAEVERPVVIHARSSEREVLAVLGNHPGIAERVVFHCWSGDAALTDAVLAAGHWLSFTGVVTFRNAAEIRAAALRVPDDRLMVETDAPYLTPEPHRRVRPNVPEYVAVTARFLAELRGERFEDFARRTTRNAERFFGLAGDTT